jgi:YD repeat-containing protein
VKPTFPHYIKQLIPVGLLFVCLISIGCKTEDIGIGFKVDLTGKIKSVTFRNTEPKLNTLLYEFTYDDEGKQTGYTLTDSTTGKIQTALYKRDSTGKLLSIVTPTGAALWAFTYDRSGRLTSNTYYNADSVRYKEEFTYVGELRDYFTRQVTQPNGNSFYDEVRLYSFRTDKYFKIITNRPGNDYEEEDIEMGTPPNEFKAFLKAEWPLPVMGGYAVCPRKPIETVQIFSGITYTFNSKSIDGKFNEFTIREKSSGKVKESWIISYY